MLTVFLALPAGCSSAPDGPSPDVIAGVVAQYVSAVQQNDTDQLASVVVHLDGPTLVPGSELPADCLEAEIRFARADLDLSEEPRIETVPARVVQVEGRGTALETEATVVYFALSGEEGMVGRPVYNVGGRWALTIDSHESCGRGAE